MLKVLNSNPYLNFCLYPLVGGATGALLSKTFIPLTLAKSAFSGGALTTAVALLEKSTTYLSKKEMTPLTKIAIAAALLALAYIGTEIFQNTPLLGRASSSPVLEYLSTHSFGAFFSYSFVTLLSTPTSPKITVPPKKKPSNSLEKNQPLYLPLQKKVGNTSVHVVFEGVFHPPVQAIVNAANTTLLGGGGIDAAIHGAAGSKLVEACEKIPLAAGSNSERIGVGEAVITPSFKIQNINSKITHIIHAVGPTGTTLNRKKLLADAYRNSLDIAKQNKVRSIAFPAISCGIFGYPFAEAQEVAYQTVQEYLRDNPTAFDAVYFCYLTTDINEEKREALEKAWAYLDSK